jgi:hypothetical protein
VGEGRRGGAAAQDWVVVELDPEDQWEPVDGQWGGSCPGTGRPEAGDRDGADKTAVEGGKPGEEEEGEEGEGEVDELGRRLEGLGVGEPGQEAAPKLLERGFSDESCL